VRRLLEAVSVSGSLAHTLTIANSLAMENPFSKTRKTIAKSFEQNDSRRVPLRRWHSDYIGDIG
jgi:hypothetical protein